MRINFRCLYISWSLHYLKADMLTLVPALASEGTDLRFEYKTHTE